MFSIARGSTRGLADVEQFIVGLGSHAEFFENDSEIYVARAPGRLDVMGGIADYSGSLVLQLPIREAAICALQKNDDKNLRIVSITDGDAITFEAPLSDFCDASYESAREYFKREKESSWAAYIAGVFLVLTKELGVVFDHGANILINSSVPQGKGVSSSAAIEVAAMNAVCTALNIDIDARELAILCQKVENLIVGAPCGVMDQMSSSCGEQGKLLSLLCQPAELKTPVEIPAEIAFWGIDSGVRHSVGAGDYGSVRTGAFMGKRIVGVGDYLADVSPQDFENEFAAKLPEQISGEEFLKQYDDIDDTVTIVDPEKMYAVLKPTAHPIYENARVHRFAELLQTKMCEATLNEMGALMYASHESYSACGLGSDATDLLVELVKQNDGGLYGAKITGGGSGGTVAVLGKNDAGDQIQKVADEFEKRTGYRSYIFSGSSPGAATFGHLVLG